MIVSNENIKIRFMTSGNQLLDKFEITSEKGIPQARLTCNNTGVYITP
jgi:hypothetical protein